MIDSVRLTYAALRNARPQGRTVATRTVDAASPHIHLGLDGDGKQHLLVESATASADPSDVASISVASRDLAIGEAPLRYLDVALESGELAEVFDHFVSAVLERAGPADADLGLVVHEILDRWRTFFAEMGRPPARETLTGVIGELLMLRDVARIDPHNVLAIWVGPRGGRHDLRHGHAAVEVKTTRSHTARSVTIHGEDQLLAPDQGTLHLHFVRLEEVAGLGVCLIDLVDELASMGVMRVDLFDALAAAGVPPATFAAVGSVRFDVRERETFPVDEGTPRIVPSTFADGKRPPGIVDMTYRIDLDHIADRALDAPGYEALLSQLRPSSKA